jgi:hypothetical protein
MLNDKIEKKISLKLKNLKSFQNFNGGTKMKIH